MSLEGKADEAVGGLTEEENKLITFMRTFKIKARMDTPDEISKLAKALTGVKEEEPVEKRAESAPKLATHHFPKLSTFYGEDGKGEATWDAFKYEVLCLIEADTYSQEQLMFGIRRALKGKASDKIRRLGPGCTPRYVLEKLESDYGTVENKEVAMKNLYTCEQKPNESVESYATRVEECFYKTVEHGSFGLTQTEVIKQVFYSNLNTELKQMSTYQFDKIKEYDDFKKELRKMEADMKPKAEEKKPCKPVVSNEKKEDSEVTQLLKQLNERIDRLEKGHSHDQFDQQHHWYGNRDRGRGTWRGSPRGRGQNFGGRGTYRPQRPFSSGTFAPTCFLCNRKGHVQVNCPTILAQLICAHCKEKGHIRKDCPKL